MILEIREPPMLSERVYGLETKARLTTKDGAGVNVGLFRVPGINL